MIVSNFRYLFFELNLSGSHFFLLNFISSHKGIDKYILLDNFSKTFSSDAQLFFALMSLKLVFVG